MQDFQKAFQQECERVIADMAATVITHVETRRHHPSYGYTKGAIRAKANQMDGAIGLMMVLSGQANHTGAASLASFLDPGVADCVRKARQEVETL